LEGFPLVSIQVIRDLVSSYISGAISASDLANAFPPVFISAQKSRDDAARDLALKVRDQLAHFSNGFLSEGQLYRNLSPYAEAVEQGFAVVESPSIQNSVVSYNSQRSAVVLEVA
jgi:hypothetical protein